MAIVADGIQYAEQVVAGEIVACELVRLACQRFLNDLEHGPERGIYFIEDRAQHILEFYSFIPHVKGALAGKPIDLMPWHVFILINIFGFVIPLIDEQTGKEVVDEDGDVVFVRRFRTAYNEVARKNAKSTLSSGIGLYMTGADGEGGAEVYSAATTRDQARIVFEDAKNMLKKSKATLGRLFEFNKLAIYQERTASKFEPLSSDANNLDGLNIHCGIVDELHAHKTRDVWDVLETATGARLQSLLFGITTAGFNKEGICYELRDYGIKVLRGQVDDDSFFAIIYTLDKDDDPFDETVWQKANPGLGVCKRWDDLRRLAKKAKEQVSARINFFTKHMNIWVTAESSWMDTELKTTNDAINKRIDGTNQDLANTNQKLGNTDKEMGRIAADVVTNKEAISKTNEAMAKSEEQVQAQFGKQQGMINQKMQAEFSQTGDGVVTHSINITIVHDKVKYNAAGQVISAQVKNGKLESFFGYNANNFAWYNPANGKMELFMYAKNGQFFVRDLFIEDGSITNAKIGDVIQSNNYVAGKSGWIINKNGYAEFDNAKFRGEIKATKGTMNNVIIDKDCEIKGTLKVENIEGDIVKFYSLGNGEVITIPAQSFDRVIQVVTIATTNNSKWCRLWLNDNKFFEIKNGGNYEEFTYWNSPSTTLKVNTPGVFRYDSEDRYFKITLLACKQ